MTKAAPHDEANRYISNAKEALKKAQKKGQIYGDIKYVQTASGIAYNAALLAVDAYLAAKEGGKYTKPKSIDDYRFRLSKQNKNVLSLLNDAYDQLHLAGYYHGTPSVRTISNGFEAVEKIIAFITP